MNARIITTHNGLLNTPGNVAFYSHDDSPIYEQELIKKGFKRFFYFWKHVPSKVIGVNVLWTDSENTARALVDFWGKCDGNWQYRLLITQSEK